MTPIRTALTSLLLATVAAAASAATPDDLPARKPGLWQLSLPGGPDHPNREFGQCIDAATDKRMRDMAEGQVNPQCSKPVWHVDGAARVGESTCKTDKGVNTIVTRISGDPQSDYRVEVTQTNSSTPGPAKPLVLTAKWVGPCTGDQKPGDMILPGGRSINIEQMTPKQTPR